MCGIVGVAGREPALPFILGGLSRLEYRGYDSAGVALNGPDGIWVRRRVGKLAELVGAVDGAPTEALSGIGHTRWATHGRPSERNAHPHSDGPGRLALVHNGIIENHRELGDELVAKGCDLRSETDTEVLAHLISRSMLAGRTLADAVRESLGRVDGSYAIAVVHADEPHLVVAARRGSPLVAGRTDTAAFVASDIPALLLATREIYVLADEEVVEVRPGHLRVTSPTGEERPQVRRHVEWDLEAAEKAGYPHFMLKEIHEQPQAVRETLRGRVRGGRLVLDELSLTKDELRNVDKLFVVGCGSSYYAGLAARHAIEHWARLPTEIEVASEFRYRDPVLDANSLVVGVSQSGESLDTMEACRFARSATNKARVLAVCNVVDSSMAREADAVLYTRAGPEIGVAATKTHVAQVVALQLLALHLAELRGTLYPDEATHLVDGLGAVPGLIEELLAGSEPIEALGRTYADTRDFFFLGRGVGYPVALEGALKLKEISYARAEAYPAGEMKHGPIALIEPGTVVLAVATRGRLQTKVLNNIDEVKARGARVVVVANPGDDRAIRAADDVICVPALPLGAELFTPLVDVVALQMFAYAVARARGLDVDQPRNLAKTVTVE
ncbi:MAG: glutamine--fructose-6-phosphate transaminase (isomerizing) [Acidimicrobiales bacterium]